MQNKLIDRFLASTQIVTRKTIMIEASPDEIYQTLMSLDCTKVAEDSRLMRVLSWMRETPHHLCRLPNRFYCWVRGRAYQGPEEITYQLKQLTDQGTWVKLAAKPNAEFVFGLVGKLWEKNYGALTICADEFVSFARPGFAKTACSFAIEPLNGECSLLVYEIRTATTDRRTRALFYLYWLSIEVGVLYLMRRLLRVVKDEAEKQNLQHWNSDTRHMKGHAA